jgi:hypothetical protein
MKANCGGQTKAIKGTYLVWGRLGVKGLASGAMEGMQWCNEFNIVGRNEFRASKKQNYEIVKATSSLSHLGLTCFLRNPL